MENTEISWTDNTFNPWMGCTKVSAGCQNCYAETTSLRTGKKLWGSGIPRHRTSEKYWAKPLKWNAKAIKAGNRPRVFVASMADVFDAEVAATWRDDLWNLIRECPALDWQLLTKRPENISGMLPADWGDGWRNVWLGTTVENQDMAKLRVPILREIPAAVRFISCEPLIGYVAVPLDGIHWVICGGESGARYRPMKHSWAAFLRDLCVEEGIPFHFKQWGTNNKVKAGRLLDGRTWDEFPAPAA
ncbi:MAG: phage Gp37/Gp68 family protein [Terrimicrobiaceae bacterium]|nr:phage Gp37/Gp68 family protein [Terrimicrobiaceae bacterium]